MSRPALSASRSIAIIEMLSAFPERQFGLSEIVKATGINIASSHAILNVLCEKGYLVRNAKQRTYSLGPSLIATGAAAQRSQPIISHAIDAAYKLRDELDLPVLLSTVVGGEILAVLSLPNSAGIDAGMHVGERLPLLAPVGAPFLAWGSEDEIEQWFARRTEPFNAEQRALLDEDLHLTRKRGYQVHLLPPEASGIGLLMAQMAACNDITDYKNEVRKLVQEYDTSELRAVEFEPDLLYDVMLIASPIFDQEGKAAYNLAVGGFPRQLSGRNLLAYADRLSRTCLEVMRSERLQSRRQGATANGATAA